MSRIFEKDEYDTRLRNFCGSTFFSFLEKKIPVVRILLVTQHLEIERDAVSCLYDTVAKKKKKWTAPVH